LADTIAPYVRTRAGTTGASSQISSTCARGMFVRRRGRTGDRLRASTERTGCRSSRLDRSSPRKGRTEEVVVHSAAMRPISFQEGRMIPHLLLILVFSGGHLNHAYVERYPSKEACEKAMPHSPHSYDAQPAWAAYAYCIHADSLIERRRSVVMCRQHNLSGDGPCPVCLSQKCIQNSDSSVEIRSILRTWWSGLRGRFRTRLSGHSFLWTIQKATSRFSIRPSPPSKHPIMRNWWRRCKRLRGLTAPLSLNLPMPSGRNIGRTWRSTNGTSLARPWQQAKRGRPITGLGRLSQATAKSPTPHDRLYQIWSHISTRQSH
jgi:hypothetical protein